MIPRDKPLPGATVDANGVFFRVWAPHCTSVDVEFSEPAVALPLTRDDEGYFSGHSAEARAGTSYRFRLDHFESHPDPYSRFQGDGPHGPSTVVDPNLYQWSDSAWRGLDPAAQIIYELHIGTFTEAGTYDAAADRLPYLQDLGVTCIELMPVNEFQGRFGWGYDGVNWFAPFHHYGSPDALRRFVDRAHALQLGVILDVVYNHFGHHGNYLPRYAAEYFTDAFANPWGSAPNYACKAMQRLAIDNAAYWIKEFHLDGLRLDAIQSVHDPDPPTLLEALVREARAAADHRIIVIAAEDYLQRSELLGGADTGGAALDQLWNDDFHHTCRVALTGNHFGYFGSYRGSAPELLSSMRNGFLFQGQYDGWLKEGRGSPVTYEPRTSFVAFTQNHDAVANTLHGQRLPALSSPAKYRAITAALLLGPQTPMLFMGQEFNATTPFAYFADCEGSEAQALWDGRRKEAQQFEPYRDHAALSRVLDPSSMDTVRRSTLIFAETDSNPGTVNLFRDLIALRRGDAVLAQRPAVRFDGAVLNEHALILRWFDAERGDRLLLINLGAQLEPRAWPEPLLAAPVSRQWRLAWSSESPRYGGMGAVTPWCTNGWQLPAECAILMSADRSEAMAANVPF